MGQEGAVIDRRVSKRGDPTDGRVARSPPGNLSRGIPRDCDAVGHVVKDNRSKSNSGIFSDPYSDCYAGHRMHCSAFANTRIPGNEAPCTKVRIIGYNGVVS